MHHLAAGSLKTWLGTLAKFDASHVSFCVESRRGKRRDALHPGGW